MATTAAATEAAVPPKAVATTKAATEAVVPPKAVATTTGAAEAVVPPTAVATAAAQRQPWTSESHLYLFTKKTMPHSYLANHYVTMPCLWFVHMYVQSILVTLIQQLHCQ